MRYEAKHRYFKRLATFMGNFTNVPYTMTEIKAPKSTVLLSKWDWKSDFPSEADSCWYIFKSIHALKHVSMFMNGNLF